VSIANACLANALIWLADFGACAMWDTRVPIARSSLTAAIRIRAALARANLTPLSIVAISAFAITAIQVPTATRRSICAPIVCVRITARARESLLAYLIAIAFTDLMVNIVKM
jgi:hypothetical protein